MATFLTRSRLSKGDLRLYLTNQDGDSQDAVSVLWTIYSYDGRQISGKDLPAIRSQLGEYYAPWASDVANGNYRIVWKIRETWKSVPFDKSESFYIVDPASYVNGLPISQSAVPVRGQGTYLSGQTLGRGDLPLFLTDDTGVPTDAYSVFWTVLDASGIAVTDRTVAIRADLGEYYALWTVMVISGNYDIVWEWQQDSGAPLQSQKMRFSIVSAGAPFAVIIPSDSAPSIQIDFIPKTATIIPQMGSVSSYQVCCVQTPSFSNQSTPIVYPPPVACGSGPSPIEIPRAIHLANGLLPPGGAFTNQTAYLIPQAIRSITFYVNYVRGAVGGFASLRLLWGDGTDEFSETALDTAVNINDPIANQNLYLQEFDSPIPSDNMAVHFLVETSIPGGARTARLIAAERGTPVTPGILGITLTAST